MSAAALDCPPQARATPPFDVAARTVGGRDGTDRDSPAQRSESDGGARRPTGTEEGQCQGGGGERAARRPAGTEAASTGGAAVHPCGAWAAAERPQPAALRRGQPADPCPAISGRVGRRGCGLLLSLRFLMAATLAARRKEEEEKVEEQEKQKELETKKRSAKAKMLQEEQEAARFEEDMQELCAKAQRDEPLTAAEHAALRRWAGLPPLSSSSSSSGRRRKRKKEAEEKDEAGLLPLLTSLLPMFLTFLVPILFVAIPAGFISFRFETHVWRCDGLRNIPFCLQML